jgi:TetR/AcrR family transcriptional regulator, transcriptional repressor of bet genes
MVRSIDWVYNQSMGRRSLRQERRAELVTAFARVLARHGFAGATVAAVASEAGVSPSIVHHYFTDKGELLAALVAELLARFRRRTRTFEAETDPLAAYIFAALALDGTADVVAARCWVGVFAEAIREPGLFDQVRRLLDTEVQAIRRRSSGALSEQDSAAVLAFVVGSLVFGAFAPRKTAGFAAPSLQRLIQALSRRRRDDP